MRGGTGGEHKKWRVKSGHRITGNEKNGYISRSFRMYRSLAEEFKQACDSAGVSQAEAIQRLMREFIANQKPE